MGNCLNCKKKKKTKENTCSGVKNPLLIDLILNVVFDYLKPKDLKNSRAVCKLWDSSVLRSRAWRRGAQVGIDTYMCDEHTLENFLKVVQNGNGACISENYDIRGDVTSSNAFWSFCGNWIKILRMDNIKFGSVDEFRAVVYKACPNMEQLTLQLIWVHRSENERNVLEPINYTEPQFGEQKNLRFLALNSCYESYGVSWMELLSHFPNLEGLSLKGGHFSGFFISFSKIRLKFPDKLKLKHFTAHLTDNPYPEIFYILKDRGLQLQTIDTNRLGTAENFREILEINVSFLKKLALGCSDYNPHYDHYHIFPLRSAQRRTVQLDALQELQVDGETFLSLAILKFTPNLKILVISYCPSGGTVVENTPLSEMGGVSLKMCKKLSFADQLSLDSLRKLIIWCPNVKELQLNELTNAHFQMICESWTGLVSFVSRYGSVDDLGLTGLDEEDVQRINEYEELSDWRPITVPRANISALKGLKRLHMYRSSPGTAAVSYCAAVCGIELLPRLEKLYLEPPMMEESIRKRLQSRFPHMNFGD